MRLIMMGTGPFAVPTFRSLLDTGQHVAVLVTRPSPAVRSRGKTPLNPMREAAAERGIQVLSPQDVNTETARKQIASLRPDLFVVCDYGQILSAATLAIPTLGGINLHGSLLPKYRGAAPVNWALLNGETESGVTVLHMTPKLDAGPTLCQRSTLIEPDECADQLEPRLAQLGPAAVDEAIDLLRAWDGRTPIGTVQDPSLATPARRLKKQDGQIDWSCSAERIRNQVRALKPWPGTFTHWSRNGRTASRLILDQVSVATDLGSGEPGAVLKSDSGQLWIAAGDGILAVERLQPAGKRVMDVREFLRGHPIEVGTRLGV